MNGFVWFRNLLVVMLVPAATVMSSAGAALAATETGTGTIQAHGVGVAALRGSGDVTIERGAGTVWVSGTAQIQTEGTGRRITLPDGTIRLTGYTGKVVISGEAITVRVAGGAINLTATGTGSVFLKGKGSYTVNETSGTWSRDGVVVQF